MSGETVRVLWLTPDKPDNISVGRKRIATQLRKRDIAVDLRGTSLDSVVSVLQSNTEYDAIIGTTRAGAIVGTILGQIWGNPVIVDHVDPIRQFRETHGKVLSWPVRLAENVAFALSAEVLYVYQEEQPRVTRFANSTIKTELGVDYDRFSNPDPKIVESAQKRLEQLDLRDQVIIYVGGLEPIYHLEPLLKSMSELPDFSLIIAGDGSLKERVIESANKQTNIHYLGTIAHKKIPGCLQFADIGVSLVDDPHTLKVLEYGAAGLKVVQAAGRAEDRFGDLVNYCDPQPKSIAAAIKQAAKNGEAENLHEYVENFDWENIATQYEESILKNIK